MANKEKKFPENVPGKYYVDQECVVCGICESIAPENFKLSAEHAFVYKQPINPEQAANCEKAFSGCPVRAIGRDGK